MRKKIIIILVLIVAGIVFVFSTKRPASPEPKESAPEAIPQIIKGENLMQLTSSAFQDNQNIPAKYTCDGDDINPSLTFIDVPANAKSLALIVDDPDAPRGDWVHWLVWNIKPDTTSIAENSVPSGAVEGITDFGRPGWGGPCPPSGLHHYQFKLYALDTELFLPAASRKAALEKAMAGHILGQAELVGLYQRP